MAIHLWRRLLSANVGEHGMMGRQDERPSTPTTREEAADWIVRLSADDVGELDWLEFQAWLEAGKDRRAAFDAAQAFWLELDRHQAALAVASEVPAAHRRPRRRRSAFRWRPAAWIGVSAAAAAAVCAVLLAPIIHVPGRVDARAPVAATYATAAGQHLTVTLADGTRMDLDGASQLSTIYSRTARKVTMRVANVAFDVAKDPRRPFVISVGDSVVKVVGTAFDISQSGDETRVTVSRGVVQFRLASASEPTLRLTPGMSVLHRDGTAVAQVSRVAPTDATAWRGGRLIYRNAPLSRVLLDLNREYRQPIQVGDAAAGELRFTGVLVIGPEADVVRRLTALLPIRAQASGAAIVLRSTRP